ncbi:MAG: hypothetical protein QOC92_2801, partial [Acidimicrobiaceae bacterium]
VGAVAVWVAVLQFLLRLRAPAPVTTPERQLVELQG